MRVYRLGVLLLSEAALGQETTRVSVDSSGVEATSSSFHAAISADGQVVAFASLAWNLVPGTSNGASDVYVHDRSTGVTLRVSVDATGAEGDGGSYEPAISADGQVVAFQSDATNLVGGDTNGRWDVFVHDRSTGTTERISVDSTGVEANHHSRVPSISADGQILAFRSNASNLVGGDKNGDSDIFVRDRAAGTTVRVSLDSSGAEGNDGSFDPSISADGQLVAFQSDASNLVPGDTNAVSDIFVHDRSTGVTERISVDSSGAEAGSWSQYPSISADGRFVTFTSNASNLVAADKNGIEDVFVHDRVTGITELVSVSSSGTQGNQESGSYGPEISADGRFVAFNSDADNLVEDDANHSSDVFIRDRSAGITIRASVDSLGVEGNSWSAGPSIAGDGQVVAFESPASNLVAGDTEGFTDIFVHERCAIDATWSNYGVGFPGTNGEPSLTSQVDPVLGTLVTVDVGNSYGRFTVGLLFIGFQRTQVPTNWGGDLLVVPEITLLVALAPGGASLSGDIPADGALCGFIVDLQAIELDPGAARGVSFTPGLELLLGH